MRNSEKIKKLQKEINELRDGVRTTNNLTMIDERFSRKTDSTFFVNGYEQTYKSETPFAQRIWWCEEALKGMIEKVDLLFEHLGVEVCKQEEKKFVCKKEKDA